MKAKITKGKNFKTIINYVFSPGEKNKKDRADWIGGTLGSNSPQEMIKDFDTVQRLRPHIEKPSWHCSLTLPEGEYLSDADWSDVVEDFMEKMEFSKLTPYTIVRHNDTEFDHVHVIASRVPMTGPVWTGRNDVYKAIAATQELEKEYNLTQTPGYKKRESARETYRERKKAERTGVTPPRIQLQELIDEVVADKPTAPQLAQRLEDKGVIVRANVASTGKMNGFSFELDGLAFKGSSLGKAYSWSGLQKRGITYNVETDAVELERYRLPVTERSPRTDEILPETFSSTLTVETSLELEADTDSTSPEPGAEKMLRALEGYYQSEINKNKEAIETSPKQDFAENSPTGTAPTASDVDTDSVEAAKLEAAINAVSEIFNQSVEQGKSRALSEFLSSESSLKIEDTAQQNSTEAAPEATQPPVELSALSEASPQEPGQQQQWVENLCYDLADLLNHEKTPEIKGKRRTVTWNREQKRLTLRENKTQKIVLDAEWDEKEARWKDNGSTLSHAEGDEISHTLDKWRADRDREQERERQPHSASKGLER